MSQPSIFSGDTVPGFPAPITSIAGGAGIGTVYAVVPFPGFEEQATWSYEFGVAPDAIVINLEGSLNGVNFGVLDTWNTPGTSASRTVNIGANKFLRLNVTGLTLGGGTLVGGHISV